MARTRFRARGPDTVPGWGKEKTETTTVFATRTRADNVLIVRSVPYPLQAFNRVTRAYRHTATVAYPRGRYTRFRTASDRPVRVAYVLLPLYDRFEPLW